MGAFLVMPIEMKILWVEKAVARGWNNKTFKIYDSDRHDFWFYDKAYKAVEGIGSNEMAY